MSKISVDRELLEKAEAIIAQESLRTNGSRSALADKFQSLLDEASAEDAPNRFAINGYRPPKGVVGYARKSDLEAFHASGCSYDQIGLDHPNCWEDEPPFDHLVPLILGECQPTVEQKYSKEAGRLKEGLKYLQHAVSQANEDGRAHLGILSVQEDGGGRIIAKFECDDFFHDLATVLGAGDLTEDDKAEAVALQFLQQHGLHAEAE